MPGRDTLSRCRCDRRTPCGAPAGLRVALELARLSGVVHGALDDSPGDQQGGLHVGRVELQGLLVRPDGRVLFDPSSRTPSRAPSRTQPTWGNVAPPARLKKSSPLCVGDLLRRASAPLRTSSRRLGRVVRVTSTKPSSTQRHNSPSMQIRCRKSSIRWSSDSSRAPRRGPPWPLVPLLLPNSSAIAERSCCFAARP